MLTSDLSSVILAIFLRKGGEGVYTKIVEKTSIEIDKLYKKDNEGEVPLIVSYNDTGYIIFTNQRVVKSINGGFNSITYSDLENVRPALFDEFKNLVVDKKKFTKLCVREKNGNEFLLILESGNPYAGIYQFLSFLCSKHKTPG